MLNSMLELINLVASNSFVVFCFCNLIIIILLVGISKTASDTNEDRTSLPSNGLVRGSKKYMTAHSKKSHPSFNDKNEFRSFTEPCRVERKQEDDELTERVEAFIDKTTKAWKAEMLQKSIITQ
ncbi:hypothetical protein DCAR_0520744 [Daucus carota subsp. sativus]|uniref:Uncharacterized protein n=1 Tax=Daucus carota subsp. sativus TaxID=79200 RepID=A0A162A1W3_DAUCS|nr:hypothetical protein DCAR_0520744 [Daucus carota subsp. sativus]